MRIFGAVFLLVFFAYAALAQSIAAGIKGGFASAEYGRSATSGPEGIDDGWERYTVGASVEVALPLHLAAEADALYRPLEFTADTGIGGPPSSHLHERTHAWEFPLLLKYRFRSGLFAPFIAAGYAPRRISGSFDLIYATPSGGPHQTHGGVDRVLHGLVLGGGAQVDLRHTRLSLELRYLHWNDRYLYTSDGRVTNYSDANQVELLFGVSFY